MASVIHLDTHVLVWLYLPRVDLLTTAAQAAIEAGPLAVSPICVLELTHLHEVGRLTVDGPTVMASLAEQLGVEVDAASFRSVVGEANSHTWTRDPFDRLIAAQAVVSRATLVTADDRMRRHVAGAVW